MQAKDSNGDGKYLRCFETGEAVEASIPKGSLELPTTLDGYDHFLDNFV